MSTSNSRRLSSPRKFMGLTLISWIIHVGIVIASGFILYAISPIWMNYLVYQLLIKYFHIVAVVITMALLYFVFLYMASIISNRRYKYGFFELPVPLIFFIALTIGLVILSNKYANYLTYKRFASQVVIKDEYLHSDLNNIRYTPLRVAHSQMESTIRQRTEEVNFRHVNPYISQHGFGYVVPVTPDGLRPTFNQKNPGFILYRDDFDADTVIKRIEQPFQTGVEMQITDNLYRILYRRDFWSMYNNVHYMCLDSTHSKKFTAIAPKTKYKYAFPIFFMEYWSGTTLIHDDGSIEDLTVEQVQRDPRLQGKWAAPAHLFKKHVELQDFAVGYWNTFSSVNGMLTVPQLTDNKYPLLFYGADGQTYFVIDTEPQGSGRGMYRMYYQHATTGEMSYYEPEGSRPIIGPRGAISKVYSLRGYNWFQAHGGEGGTSGNMMALEPVYIIKNKGEEEILYWKFTVTSLDRTRVSATVVVEAEEGGEMFEFTDRKSFEAWLHDSPEEILVEKMEQSDVLELSRFPGEKLQEIKQKLLEALEMVNELEKVVQ